MTLGAPDVPYTYDRVSIPVLVLKITKIYMSMNFCSFNPPHRVWLLLLWGGSLLNFLIFYY